MHPVLGTTILDKAKTNNYKYHLIQQLLSTHFKYSHSTCKILNIQNKLVLNDLTISFKTFIH